MLTFWLTGTLLMLIQGLAALPWLAVLEPDLVREHSRRPGSWFYAIASVVISGIAFGQVLHILQSPERLEVVGRIFGAVLQVQLTIDFFILVLALITASWSKGGAVALAAFREGVRQPLFWSIAGLGAFLLVMSLFVPYFTFGDDIKFMKLLGYDFTMLFPAVFGVLAAGMSITEEIEGRTALTLLSKPVSRRQFLLGKYAGILLAALALTALLGWVFQWTLYFKPFLEPLDDPADPLQAQVQPWLLSLATALNLGSATPALAGTALWFSATVGVFLGLAVGFCQVMILTAVAAALATRLPMLVTLVICLLLFFLGHLAPVLLEVAERLQVRFALEHGGQTSVALDLIQFMARLFDTLLPALEFFNLGPAVIRDRPLPIGEYALYTGSVVVYSAMYTAIALLFGLILFEDRDLA